MEKCNVKTLVQIFKNKVKKRTKRSILKNKNNIRKDKMWIKKRGYLTFFKNQKAEISHKVGTSPIKEKSCSSSRRQ